MPDPSTQNQNNQSSPAVPAAVPDSMPLHTDLPPLPPDFSAQSAAPAGVQESVDTGSAAPADLPPMTVTPKKKFGGGKIIATILGILLLVGGVGTGVYLTQQQQRLNSGATSGQTGTGCGGNGYCASGTHCNAGSCVADTPVSHPDVGTECGNGLGECTGAKAGYSCNNGLCIPPTGGAGTPPPGGQASCGGCDSPGIGWHWLNGACVAKSDAACDCTVVDGKCSVAINPGYGSSCPAGTSQSSKLDHNISNCQNGQLCTTPVYDCKTTSGTNNGTYNGTKTCVDSAQCSGSSGTTPPTATPSPTAMCQNIKAYSSTWTLLTTAQLSALSAGNIVNFCVTGSASSGLFDKAKLTINGIAQAETTTVRPSSTDFCQSYTIPAATTAFNVTAQIHHVTLGWK